MRILHYSLGFPPYRTGGLTKYCIDLMQAQKENGNSVALLWPGQMKIGSSQMLIKERKTVEGIRSFELVNPLPVPLDEGIADIDSYVKKGDEQVFQKFLLEFAPDVIHVHTFMGLYREFLETAKKSGIKIIFTTHDYFGLCPKVTFFRNGQICENHNFEECASCNKTALSIKKIKLMQSPVYKKWKDTKLVKQLRKRHRKNFFEDCEKEIVHVSSKSGQQGYKKLRDFYKDMYSLVNGFHFNSTLTKEVYERYLEIRQGSVIPISHQDIADHRTKKEFQHKLKLAYLGPAKALKGYYFLKDVLDELYFKENFRFELKIFSDAGRKSPYMIEKEGYGYHELGNIFKDTDLVMVPSVWNETFSFLVLEALSYGVPVLISERVGARDVVKQILGEEWILELSKEKWKEKIVDLMKNKKVLKDGNRRIIESSYDFSYKKHYKEMMKFYMNVSNRNQEILFLGTEK